MEKIKRSFQDTFKKMMVVLATALRLAISCALAPVAAPAFTFSCHLSSCPHVRGMLPRPGPSSLCSSSSPPVRLFHLQQHAVANSGATTVVNIKPGSEKEGASAWLPTDVVSQSDMVALLWEHRAKLGATAEQTIEALEMCEVSRCEPPPTVVSSRRIPASLFFLLSAGL